jgi:uncharacterized protein YaiL (DUF2058 family)
LALLTIRIANRRRHITETASRDNRILIMVDSLRDLLLKSGIVKQLHDERRANQPGGGPPGLAKRQTHHAKPKPAPSRNQDEIDLAKAYAIRAQKEANERKHAEQQAAEQARLKRERKAKLQQLLDGKRLNKADADQVRHFEYNGKIRRVYVDAAQLVELNAGKLGVVQHAGHYLLVSQSVAEQVRTIDPQQLALLVDSSTGGIGDDGVPDDLMW